MSDYMERFIKSADLGDALSVFDEALDRFGGRIAETRKKIDDLYGGITPRSPYFEFTLSDGIALTEPAWADTQHKRYLSDALSAVIQNFERLPPCYDYLPYAGLLDLGGSGFICGLFGTTFINYYEKGIDITKHAIADAGEIKNLKTPNLNDNELFMQTKEYVEFLAEKLNPAVDITYPQLQGPSTNSLRVLPEEEGLIGILTEPEEMEKLSLMVTRLMIDFFKALHESAGGAHRFRPRVRFGVPDHIKGLMVDDWISVVSPDDFKKVYASSYELMHKELGGIFLHTCGPVLHIADLLADLKGLEVLESVFIEGTRKTTEDLLKMKEAAAGRYTFGTVQLPDGSFVQDEENLTPELVRRLSDGGRYMFQASGTKEYAERLARRLELY